MLIKSLNCYSVPVCSTPAIRAELSVTIVILLAICSSIIAQSPSGGAIALHHQADEHHKAGSLEKALELYTRSLEIEPSAESYNNIGITFIALGRYAEASEYLKKGIQLFPKSDRLHRHRGVALYQLGNLADAVDHYREAVRLRPDYLAAYTDLGMTLTELKRSSEAIVVLEKAVAMAPANAVAHNNLGWAYIVRQKYRKARAVLERAVELDSDLPEARFLLAVSYAMTDNRDAALRQYAYLKRHNSVTAANLYALLYRNNIVAAK